MRVFVSLLLVSVLIPQTLAVDSYANCNLNEICYDENLDLSSGDIFTWSYVSFLRDGERLQDNRGLYWDKMMFQIEINFDIGGLSLETLEENSQYAFTVSTLNKGDVVDVNNYTWGIGFIYPTINNTNTGPVNYLVQRAKNSPFTVIERQDYKKIINNSIIDGFFQSEVVQVREFERTNDIYSMQSVIEKVNLTTGFLVYQNSTFLQDGVLSVSILQFGQINNEIRLDVPFSKSIRTGIVILVIISVIFYIYNKRQKR